MEFHGRRFSGRFVILTIVVLVHGLRNAAGQLYEPNEADSTKTIDLSPLTEYRALHEAEWKRTMTTQTVHSACVRVPMPSANTTTTAKANDNAISASKRQLLYCDNVSLSFIDDFLSNAAAATATTNHDDGNRPDLSDKTNTGDNDSSPSDNRTFFSAIILSNVRWRSTTTHTSERRINQKNIHRDLVAATAAEYLTWIKSQLTGDAVTAWASAVRQLPGLIYLDFSDNQLANMPWQLLASTIPHLHTIVLRRNNIGTDALQPNVFQRFEQLQRLDLSENNIMSIVYDRRHDADSSVGIFENHQQLVELDLSRNQITDLPRTSFNRLPRLRCLNLAHNHLSIIPFQVFHALESMEHLDLSNNRLVSILDNFFIGNKALRMLNFRNNTIEKLSKNSLYGLEQLTHLDLSDNQLISIDRNAFDSLTSLRVLNVGRNNLTVLPTILFYQLHQLQYVNLSRNNFKIIPNGLFASQHRLEELIIDETGLQRVGNLVSRQPAIVNKQTLSNLRTIRIRNNRQLREIDAIAFRNWAAVEHLNLSGNALITLPHEIGELQALKTLDVSYNQLISVPKQISAAKQLHTFSLLGNNFACDCHMAWLSGWIDETQHRVKFNESLRDWSIYAAPLNQLKQLKCRHGYPGDFLRVLQQLHCVKPTVTYVSDSKTYLLRTDAQLECAFSGNPVPDIIWVTPLNKIIRYYSDPDAKPLLLLAATSNAGTPGNGSNVNLDLEHQAKNREKIENQMLKNNRLNFTIANEVNGVTLLENGSLRVHNISRKDSGLYTCYGYNIMGYATAEVR